MNDADVSQLPVITLTGLIYPKIIAIGAQVILVATVTNTGAPTPLGGFTIISYQIDGLEVIWGVSHTVIASNASLNISPTPGSYWKATEGTHTFSATISTTYTTSVTQSSISALFIVPTPSGKPVNIVPPQITPTLANVDTLLTSSTGIWD